MLANTNLKGMLTGTIVLSGARLQACSVRPAANFARPARFSVVAKAKRRSKRAKDAKENPSAQLADIEKPGRQEIGIKVVAAAATTEAAAAATQVDAAQTATASPGSSMDDQPDDQPWMSQPVDNDDPAELALQEVQQLAAAAVQASQTAPADAAAAAPAAAAPAATPESAATAPAGAAQDDQPCLTSGPVLDDPAEPALQEVILPLGSVDEQEAAAAAEAAPAAAPDADADATQTSSTIVAEAESSAAAADAAGSAPADADAAPAPAEAAPSAVIDVEVVDSDPMWQTMPDLSQMKKTSVFGSLDSLDAEEVEGFTLPTGSKAGDTLRQLSAVESADLEVDVVWEEEDRPGILKRIPQVDAATAEKLAALLAALRPDDDDADIPVRPPTAAASQRPGSAGGERSNSAAQLSPQEEAEIDWWMSVSDAYSSVWEANKRDSFKI